ncbi:MAG: cbiQ [Bacillota bacterium]|nr:cbiQ [Bacillota bacterium]
MLIIDRFAYTNNFAELNPYMKVLFSITLILVSIINSNIYFACVLIVGVIFVTLAGARIPIKTYGKMLFAPVIYLSISILAIIFSFGFNEVNDVTKYVYIKTFDFMNFYIGIAEGAIEKGIFISLRAVSAITCMYFLILTTSINQQIKVMKKIKLPFVFIELYVLTYRFIAIFFEEAIQIQTAQKMKFGYDNYTNSMNSLGILSKTLFIRIMIRYKNMESILEIKHFDGNFI